MIFLLAVASSRSDASTVKKITEKESAGKLWLVMELDSPAKYEITKGNLYTIITIPDVSLSAPLPASIESRMMQSILVAATEETCMVSVNYKYLTSGKVYSLKNPYRIVAEFSRLSNMLLPRPTVPEIEQVTAKSLPQMFKMTVTLTDYVPYEVTTAEGGVMIELSGANSVIKSRKILTKDRLVPRVGIDQVGNNVLISMVQAYPAAFRAYRVQNPFRLVVEFDKTSKSQVAEVEVAPSGLRHVSFIKGVETGPAVVNALYVDQKSYDVFPYISPKEMSQPAGFMDGFFGLFSIFNPKPEVKYKRNTVSNMVRETDSLAGINGTFFGSYGEPLGVLMINGDIISYSIDDRTALIVDRTNNCYHRQRRPFGVRIDRRKDHCYNRPEYQKADRGDGPLHSALRRRNKRGLAQPDTLRGQRRGESHQQGQRLDTLRRLRAFHRSVLLRLAERQHKGRQQGILYDNTHASVGDSRP